MNIVTYSLNDQVNMALNSGFLTLMMYLPNVSAPLALYHGELHLYFLTQ